VRLAHAQVGLVRARRLGLRTASSPAHDRQGIREEVGGEDGLALPFMQREPRLAWTPARRVEPVAVFSPELHVAVELGSGADVVPCRVVTIGHISSEVNVTADLPSRGRLAELISIAEHAGARMTVEPHPSALDTLLDELVQLELNRRPEATHDDYVADPMGDPRPYLTAAEQGLGGTRRDNTAKDGAAALVDRVPALVEAWPPAASCRTPAPGPLRHDGQQAPGHVRHERPAPYTRPKTERHVPSSAPSAADSQLPVSSVVLPEYVATTMELEPDFRHTVMHRSATVESEANALDSLLPERTALKRLLNDGSQYALKPASASRLAHMCGAVHDTTWDNVGSRAKLDSNMKLWRKYCDGLNTPCWRPSEAGLTLHEREREAILAANFLPYALTVMRGRRGCAQAKPASAYKAYLGVRKAHSKRTVCPARSWSGRCASGSTPSTRRTSAPCRSW